MRILLALIFSLTPLLALATFDTSYGPGNWGLNGGWSTITLGTQSLQMLPANQQRAFLQIQNNGSTQIIIKLGSAQTGLEGIQIAGGSTWTPVIPPTNSVYGEAGSGSDVVQIVEGIH
jgi:hypothetical protein